MLIMADDPNVSSRSTMNRPGWPFGCGFVIEIIAKLLSSITGLILLLAGFWRSQQLCRLDEAFTDRRMKD
jgi:hypothetical protein